MKDDKNQGIYAIPLTEEQRQTLINVSQYETV
jgi:hypothetical protein